MILDVMEVLKVVFLGLVEGITEWLPISSAGHMLLAVVVLFWKNMIPLQFRDKTQPVIRKDTLFCYILQKVVKRH